MRRIGVSNEGGDMEQIIGLRVVAVFDITEDGLIGASGEKWGAR